MSKQGKRDFRPNIHFTPEKNWNNDPNGLIYIDGIWHLYYQHNPNVAANTNTAAVKFLFVFLINFSPPNQKTCIFIFIIVYCSSLL